MIWIVDAHRDGKGFVVRADEKLAAFMELEERFTSSRWMQCHKTSPLFADCVWLAIPQATE
jgi:hypothetical protein